MIEIRTARMEDYEAICQLVRQVDAIHVEKYPEYFRLPDGHTRERAHIQLWIERQDRDILLALDESGLVGVLMVILEKEIPMSIVVENQRYAVVDNLVVEEQNRGRGIGKLLIEASHLWGKERGAMEMRLQVYAKNVQAQGFYKALGFEPLTHQLRKKV
ncbi:MAG: GNAT family N-acetyltransferase [Bacteroidota bacterium]